MRNLKEISNSSILIAPSVLAADFSKLGQEVIDAENGGADLIHLDVMDGHFVPNLTMGPPVISCLRKHCGIIFDTHLMVTNPLDFIESFIKSGSDHITFHIESDNDAREVISKIKGLGASVGISIKPNTPAEAILKLLPELDLVLVMTVEPGFGGQKFMNSVMPKIRKIKDEIKKQNLNTHIQVDGGISSQTIREAFENGANNFVAGTSVFAHANGIKSSISELKSICC